MKKVFLKTVKSKYDVMETLLWLAKYIPHTKELAEMDFFIDASKIMDYLFKAENSPNIEHAFWLLRETGSDFCINKEEFEKMEKCNKKGYVEIGISESTPNEFVLEFYLY